MTKAKIFFALASLFLLSNGSSQEIKSLLPWSNVPEQAVMGMSSRDLKTILPNITPLGFQDGNEADQSEPLKDGMYSPPTDGGDYSEAVIYGLGGGRVSQFYWSSERLVSVEDVTKLRNQLFKSHGDSKVGFKARVTKDKIAKITTEVFTVEDTDLVISLSSALGVTELAILDTSDPRVDLNDLYFTFEKQRDRLREELLRLTKRAPEDETPSTTLDVLKEVIAADSNQGTDHSPSDRPKSDQTTPSSAPYRKKFNEDAIPNLPEGRARPSAIQVSIALLSAFILAVALVIFSKRRRGKG